MPRSGHVDPLGHGSELAARVGYRLGGIRPEKTLSRRALERQVDYRLGAGSVDSRQVWFLGSGGTAALLGYRPGERVGAVDARIVRDAMFGIDPATGERIRVKMERNRHARVAAAPYFTVIAEACAQAGIEPESLWPGRNLTAQLRSLTKSAARASGTVAFRSAESLLRSNESAWQTYDASIAASRAVDTPGVRFDRAEIMRRLGAHHRARALQNDSATDEWAEALDLSVGDEVLGRHVWERVKADSEIMIEQGNAGYEMTLTSPKSLSVAALLAPADTRDQWLDLVRDASRGAVDTLMARVGHGRTGHEGDGQRTIAIRGDGYAATVSIESHSRAGDPHLHGHVMIPNRVLCIDGKERAIASGGADLVNHAWWLQAEFERRLRALSVERGLIDSWEMDLATGQWEVTGADPDILAFYSQGKAAVRAEINAALDSRGLAMSKAELVMLDSRAKRKVTGGKDDQQLTWDQITTHMRVRAATAGIDLGEAFTLAPFAAASQPAAWSEAIWARTIEQVVCENKAAEITARIEAAVRCFAPHDWTDQQLRDLVSAVKTREFTPGVVRARGRVAVLKHASNRIADAETRAWNAFTSGFDTNTHRLTPETAQRHLAAWRQDSGWAAARREFTPSQEALFRHMTTGTDRVSTIVGAAGSGKTTAIDAARHALASEGKNVYGICVAAIAAQAMRDTAKVQAGTVTWLVTRITFERNPAHPARAEADALARSRHVRDRRRADRIRARYAIPSMDHLVIDEASMIPATDLATVLEWTAERGTTVTLIGDHRQLQPVGPSGMFAHVHAAHPGPELTENLRQQTDVGRECAAFLRDGNPEEALFRLAESGQVVVAVGQAHAERILVEAWAERASRASTVADRIRSVAIESDRNDQVDSLNSLARTAARTRGWVTGPDVAFRAKGVSIDYAIGDQIVITKNINRRTRPTLANGTRGIVTGVDADGVNIAYWNDEGRYEDRITAGQAVRNARHGYAMTTHKLQGQTVDSLVIDVGPDRDLSSAYVAFTRHRDDVLAVINIADIAEGPELEHLMAASSDVRLDAVITAAARAMKDRGFSASSTAHEALGRSFAAERFFADGPVLT
jgi:conjugative relaxase-like TrwC/TraI family protein